MTPATALTVGGSDSSGAAGIQADLATFALIGVHGLCAVTTLTAQSSTRIARVQAVSPSVVAEQIAVAVEDRVPDAAKTGLLRSADTVSEVAARLSVLACPLVVDPVLVDSEGRAFVEPSVVEAYRAELLPLATVATPNRAELETLLDLSIATVDDLRDHVEAISRLAPVVVVTGGTLGNETAVDALVVDGVLSSIERPRITTRNTRGSGCTFSAALTAHLAMGVPAGEGVRRAGDFAHRALVTGAGWELTPGRGPVAHVLDHAVHPGEPPG